MKEFFKRLMQAAKFVASMAYGFTVEPTIALAKGDKNAFVMIVNLIATVARAIVVVSLFVAVPAWALVPATLWVLVSFRIHLVVAIFGVIAIMAFGGEIDVFGSAITARKAA